jgi:hypothetical protein
MLIPGKLYRVKVFLPMCIGDSTETQKEVVYKTIEKNKILMFVKQNKVENYYKTTIIQYWFLYGKELLSRNNVFVDNFFEEVK